MQRVCQRCKKKFACKGDCKTVKIRNRVIDYCRCPECVRKDTLKDIKNGDSKKESLLHSELCELRLRKLKEFDKEKVVFT